MRDGDQPHARETPWARWMLGMMGDADSRFAKKGELRLAVVMAMMPNDDHFWGRLATVGSCSVWDLGDGGYFER